MAMLRVTPFTATHTFFQTLGQMGGVAFRTMRLSPSSILILVAAIAATALQRMLSAWVAIGVVLIGMVVVFLVLRRQMRAPVPAVAPVAPTDLFLLAPTEVAEVPEEAVVVQEMNIEGQGDLFTYQPVPHKVENPRTTEPEQGSLFPELGHS